MPSLRLGRYEVEKYDLPPVCARCGEEAVVAPAKRFSWSPSWLVALILLGALGVILFLILSASLTRRRTVPLPLCERHRAYWRNRAIFVYGGLVAVILLGVLAIPLGVLLDDKGITDVALLFAALGTGGVFLVWLLSAAVLQAVSIRATEITENAIALSGLSKEFVDAVREARRGEDRDDEDDDPQPRRRRREEDEAGDRPSRRRQDKDDGGYYDRDEEKPRRTPPPDAIEEGGER